jgi:hypothetical protein
VVKIVTLGKLNNDLLDALKQSSNEATRRFEQARHLFERCLVVSFFEGESYGKMRTVVLSENPRKRNPLTLDRLSTRSLQL